MGTSAATYQHLEYQGRHLPHLLDPRTAWPAEDMLQATVTAPTAAVADALATAFFVLGVDQTRAYCASHPDIGAILSTKLPALPSPVILGRDPLRNRRAGGVSPLIRSLPNISHACPQT